MFLNFLMKSDIQAQKIATNHVVIFFTDFLSFMYRNFVVPWTLEYFIYFRIPNK